MSTTDPNDLPLGGDGAAHLRTASDHWQSGRFDMAISGLTDIHGDSLTAACVSFTVAIANLKLGRHADAFAMLREAAEALVQLDREPASLVSLRIDDPDYQLARGYTLREMGRLEDAHAALQAALRSRPNDPHAIFHLGLLFVEAGDQAAAREQYVALARLDEGFARELYDRIHF